MRYVLSEEVERLKKETTIQEVETVADEGDFVRLSGRDMRLKYGFASRLAANHRELANELSLATGDLEPNPSLGGEWQAIQVQLAGPINKSNIDRTLRAIEAKRLGFGQSDLPYSGQPRRIARGQRRAGQLFVIAR